MYRSVLAALCFTSLCLPTLANQEADTQKPYHLQVICRFARARRDIFTAPFKASVQAEIRDGLKARLGDMASVDVINLNDSLKAHPEWKPILHRGDLGVLDGWHGVSDVKLHFVLIDFSDGKYRIRTRQYDGLTGLGSPRTRERSLMEADRSLVSRLAADLVLTDFGLVGEATPSDPGPELDITFRGLGLTTAPERWLKPGDVFAVSAEYRDNGRVVGRREAWALLQVLTKPEKGVAHCRLWHRFLWTPLAQPGITTRFLQLHTTEAPVRLRLIDESSRNGINGQPLAISRDDFGPNPDEVISTTTDGLAQSKNKYSHMAFVEVHTSAGGTLARVPVPILGDDVVECGIDAVDKANAMADVQMQKQFWLARVNDTRAVANQLFARIDQLIGHQENNEALAQAEAGLKDLKAAIARHQAALTALQAQAKSAGQTDAAALSPTEKSALQELSGRADALAKAITDLHETVNKENNPAIKEALTQIERARLLEKQADYGEALHLYRKALAALPSGGNKPDLQAHVDALDKEWQIKTAKHRQARHFIYNIWPKLADAKEIAANMADAHKALDACKKASDHLTVHKLWLASASQANIIAREKATLSTIQGKEAEAKKKMLVKLSTDLASLYKDANAFLTAK